MTTPTTADLLKYADLQMAAEAFLVESDGKPKVGKAYIDALTLGNKHASRFTEPQAKAFADPDTGWTVKKGARLDLNINKARFKYGADCTNCAIFWTVVGAVRQAAP